MEARQRAKLTGTNSSSELLSLSLINDRRKQRGAKTDKTSAVRESRMASGVKSLFAPLATPIRSAGVRRPLCFAGLVAFARGIKPDPIPNSAVKPLSANGTKPQGLGESVAARPAKHRPKTTREQSFSRRLPARGPPAGPVRRAPGPADGIAIAASSRRGRQRNRPGLPGPSRKPTPTRGGAVR